MKKFLLFLSPLAMALQLLACKPAPEATATTACIDPTKISKDRACTMQYDPVCGCDGKTYGNACMASNAGVTSTTKGECATSTGSGQ